MWTLNMSSTRIDWMRECNEKFKWDVDVLIKSLVILNRLRKCVMNKWRRNEVRGTKKKQKIKIKNSFWWTMHNILINQTHHHIRRMTARLKRFFIFIFSSLSVPCLTNNFFLHSFVVVWSFGRLLVGWC